MKTIAYYASALAFTGLLAHTTCEQAFAADFVCDPTNLFSVVDRAVAGTSPCTLRNHTYELETGYYQNASTVGGSQLAAYPLSILRYAATPSLEVFFDPTTRIAKNGMNGKGIYTWSRSGAGLKLRLVNTGDTAVAFRVNYTPQADETATISTRNRFDAGVIARSVLSSKFALSATVGMNNFTQDPSISINKTSSWYERLAVSDQFAKRTQAIFSMSSQSAMTTSSTAQSKYGIALRQTFAKHAMLDVQMGSTINATSSTKAHYIGAGFSLYPSWQPE